MKACREASIAYRDSVPGPLLWPMNRCTDLILRLEVKEGWLVG